MSAVLQAPELDAHLRDAVEREDLPFVVAMVADGKGVLWEGSAGESAPSVPAGPGAVFRIFSQTKAISAAAAMILIDRGLLTLDTPVASVVPEFGRVQVLEALGPDGPVLRPPRTQCTVRHLLTQTSGFAYEGMEDRMTAFRNATGDPVVPIDSLETLLRYPMVFEPGSECAYGVGVDWLGPVIEAVDGRPADRFCREEIFEPLGMTDTCFEPDACRDRLPQVRKRTGDGGFTAADVGPPRRPDMYGLGICLYSTAPDYIRFLRMVLNRGVLDGERLLSERAVDLMTETQMPDGVRVGPIASDDHTWSADVDLLPGIGVTWTAGLLRNEQNVPGRRAAGSLTWGGILNSHHWVDPANDVAAVYMTQALPFAEPRLMRRYEDFERAVYRRLADRR